MTGLMVGMASGTSIAAETLAVADNSTGELHLAGAAGTSADRATRRH